MSETSMEVCEVCGRSHTNAKEFDHHLTSLHTHQIGSWQIGTSVKWPSLKVSRINQGNKTLPFFTRTSVALLVVWSSTSRMLYDHTSDKPWFTHRPWTSLYFSSWCPQLRVQFFWSSTELSFRGYQWNIGKHGSYVPKCKRISSENNACYSCNINFQNESSI